MNSVGAAVEDAHGLQADTEHHNHVLARIRVLQAAHFQVARVIHRVVMVPHRRVLAPIHVHQGAAYLVHLVCIQVATGPHKRVLVRTAALRAALSLEQRVIRRVAMGHRRHVPITVLLGVAFQERVVHERIPRRIRIVAL